MGFFYAFITFSLMFGASLGFAAIFNTTSISVIERSREFATLRMLGYTPREINLSLIFESLLIGLIGLVIGLPIAYGTAYVFFTSFESELYYLPMLIFPRTYTLTVVIVFVVILIALIPSSQTHFKNGYSKSDKRNNQLRFFAALHAFRLSLIRLYPNPTVKYRTAMNITQEKAFGIISLRKM